MTDSSSKKRKHPDGDGKDESAEKKQKDTPASEEAKIEQAVKLAEAKEPLAGLTVKQLLVDLNNLGDVKGLDHWRRLGVTPQGRTILYNLYRSLLKQHTEFVEVVKGSGRSAALALEVAEEEFAGGLPEVDDAEAHVSDIERAADAIGEDLYHAQLAAANGASTLGELLG
jgi:hypothetical protein